jgi:hypothetical protein
MRYLLLILILILILATSAHAAPILHSRIGAAHTLYLDFEGDPAHGTPAWGTDAQRLETWQRVAEKYSPFNIDITTQATPGPILYIGSNGAWTGQSLGGVYGGTGVGYVFPENLGRLSSVGEAAAHEGGHVFGLQHQSLYPGGVTVVTYNPGNALTAPVMGKSYDAQRGLWWNGESSAYSLLDANGNLYGPVQDDVAVLASLLGYAPDQQGIIERLDDTDTFPFHADGPISITADVAAVGPMLDLRLDIFDSEGLRLATADTVSLGERIDLDLPDGDYTAVVGSHGGYGDLGTYTVGVSTPEPSVLYCFALMMLSLRSRRQSGPRPSESSTSLIESTRVTGRTDHLSFRIASSGVAPSQNNVSTTGSPLHVSGDSAINLYLGILEV